MKKNTAAELEKALEEIERLRRENAQLRKRLGIEVSEPKAAYGQSGPQLGNLLGLSSRLVGQVGGGRNRQTCVIDLGMIQSLKRFDDLEAFCSKYGFIIVDECHHLPAFTFEACVKRAPVRYILGLTATPYRRDGLQEIITLQCGPIRHTMAPVESGFSRTLFNS